MHQSHPNMTSFSSFQSWPWEWGINLRNVFLRDRGKHAVKTPLVNMRFWAPDDIITKEKWFSAITRFLISVDTRLWRACKQNQREDKPKWNKDDNEESECRVELRNKPHGPVKVFHERAGKNLSVEKSQRICWWVTMGVISHRKQAETRSPTHAIFYYFFFLGIIRKTWWHKETRLQYFCRMQLQIHTGNTALANCYLVSNFQFLTLWEGRKCQPNQDRYSKISTTRLMEGKQLFSALMDGALLPVDGSRNIHSHTPPQCQHCQRWQCCSAWGSQHRHALKQSTEFQRGNVEKADNTRLSIWTQWTSKAMAQQPWDGWMECHAQWLCLKLPVLSLLMQTEMCPPPNGAEPVLQPQQQHTQPLLS